MVDLPRCLAGRGQGVPGQINTPDIAPGIREINSVRQFITVAVQNRNRRGYRMLQAGFRQVLRAIGSGSHTPDQDARFRIHDENTAATVVRTGRPRGILVGIITGAKDQHGFWYTVAILVSGDACSHRLGPGLAEFREPRGQGIDGPHKGRTLRIRYVQCVVALPAAAHAEVCPDLVTCPGVQCAIAIDIAGIGHGR